MAVIPAITSAAKKISGKPLGIASKVLGAATVASVLYDSHINGREKAYSLDEVSSGDRYYNQYKQFMTMEKPSATLSKMKKWWFNVQQDFSYYHLAARTKGYLSGFGNTIANSLPLVALSAVALKFKTTGKVAGVLLAANGIKTLLYDVMGIGAKKSERHY